MHYTHYATLYGPNLEISPRSLFCGVTSDTGEGTGTIPRGLSDDDVVVVGGGGGGGDDDDDDDDDDVKVNDDAVSISIFARSNTYDLVETLPRSFTVI